MKFQPLQLPIMLQLSTFQAVLDLSHNLTPHLQLQVLPNPLKLSLVLPLQLLSLLPQPQLHLPPHKSFLLS